eukprot:3580878-Amphidinium_carterae.3
MEHWKCSVDSCVLTHRQSVTVPTAYETPRESFLLVYQLLASTGQWRLGVCLDSQEGLLEPKLNMYEMIKDLVQHIIIVALHYIF